VSAPKHGHELHCVEMPDERKKSSAFVANETDGGPRLKKRRRSVEQAPASPDALELPPIVEKPVVPDFHETLREDVEKEPSYELNCGKSHLLLRTAVPVVPIGKRDDSGGSVVRQYPLPRNAHAVCVAGKVFDDVACAVVWLFQVAEEFGSIQGVQEGLGDWSSPRKGAKEFAPEEPGQHPDRYEEARFGLVDEACAALREAAGRDDDVEVRMELHGLPPGVQDRSEPGRGA